MQKIDLEYYRKLIRRKQEEAVNSMAAVTDNQIDNSKTDDRNDAHYSTHLADQGSDTMGKELNSFFNMRTTKFLRKLEDALKRIDDGSYGICAGCGKPIPSDRLEEVPHTRYCVPCKNQSP